MGSGNKEKRWMFVGLGVTLIGCAWFVLSIAGMIAGAARLYGYIFGVALAVIGLIVAGIYLFRWQRIRKLLRGDDVLVKWVNGESQTIIAPTCVYVDDELVLWGVAGTRLEDVKIERQSSLGSERSYLKITIGEATSSRSPVTGSHLWRTRDLSIRIPEGQGEVAQAVLEQLKSRCRKSDPLPA
jgi:hypothetical protein